MDAKIKIEVRRDLQPIVPRFLANCEARVTALREALSARDFDKVRAIGHHLKGAGGGYGFRAITDLGACIEKAAAAKDDLTIAPCIAELAAYLSSIEVVYI